MNGRRPETPQAKDALARVRRATAARKRADREWHEAIRAAAAVCSHRTIGAAAGVNHSRVQQLVNGRDKHL